MDREEKFIVWIAVTMLVVGIFCWFILISTSARGAEATGLNMPLQYLIGADNPVGRNGYATVVPYDSGPVTRGVSVAYCNMLDETNSGRYPPYLKPSGTAKEYKEGLIDPHGPGFMRNLQDQFRRRKQQGFKYIELDNPDSYGTAFTLAAVNAAQVAGFQVLAKNPLLLSMPAMYLSHPAIVGAIVEQGAGDPHRMDRLQIAANRPALPVWFVSYGRAGFAWAQSIAGNARRFNMGVTNSLRGEYTTSTDIIIPKQGAR